jgi:hypothetical protein
MAYFNKAVAVSPKRSKHLHLAQRAKLHLENKRPDLAIEDLEAAIALQPKWYEGLDQLAAAYEGAGMWVLALQTYQEMVAARPDVIREVFERMNNVTQRLVGEVNELQQRKGSAVVKGNVFAAEIASLKMANERLEGEFGAEKQQQWAQEKQQWAQEKQQGAREKEQLKRQLKEKNTILELYRLKPQPPAMAAAIVARKIRVEGQEQGDHGHGMMGVYELMEGKEVSGRGVWQLVGGGENTMFYGSSKKWFIGLKEEMEAGELDRGWMSVKSTALTPDQTTETWQVYDGKAWPEAPKVTARRV